MRHFLRALLAVGFCASSVANAEDAHGVRTLPSGKKAVQLGDVLYRSDQVRELSAGRSISTGNAWTDGTVFIEFAADVDESRRQVARSAFSQWSGDTAIAVVESASAGNRILVSNDDENIGCGSSWIGMVGGVQDLLIKCWDTRTLAHEFGHALGARHEHVRGDRNSFVSIVDHDDLQGRYPSLWNANFAAINGGSINSAYDYASIMHYPSQSFLVVDGHTFATTIVALGVQPPGAPSGSESACSSIGACTIIMGSSDQVSPRDLLGQAYRYGRLVERTDAQRTLNGTLTMSGHNNECGPNCWRVPAESSVSVSLQPEPGYFAVLGGDACSIRAADAIQCIIPTTANRRFSAVTYRAGAILQLLKTTARAADLFANGFE